MHSYPSGTTPEAAWFLYSYGTMQNQNPPGIPVTLIVRGNNPRRKFDPEFMQQLQDSIRANGIVQPILLRPVNDGKFEIVAGERRYRAFTAEYGVSEDVFIPALIKEMTDDEARRAALSENTDRVQMTPVEEAEAAARILGFFGNDRDEAARRLGWNRTTLDRRLALMYAIPEVREALQNEAILLGHAELLAVLRKESQTVALEMLLKHPALPSVATFKEQLDRMALSLELAIFDKTACLTCHHNTGNQQALFSEALTSGNCTNKPCYEGKTDARLEQIATEMRSDYQLVRIVRPGENYTIVPIQSEGPRGVGAEQAQKCRSCKDFGAAISGLPDKLGVVYKDQCSNTACNVKMIAAHAKASAPPAEPTSATPTGNTKTTTPSTNAASKKPAPTSVEPSNAVKTYREQIWRNIFKKVVEQMDCRTNTSVLLAIAMHRPSSLSTRNLADALKPLGIDAKTSHGLSAHLGSCLDLERAQLDAALKHVAASAFDSLEILDIQGALKRLEVKLEDHWKLNADFLDKLTKNEIDAVCTELGIKVAMGGAYAKTLGGKKDELIKGVLAVEGFDYQGKIPAHMKWAKT